MSVYHSLHTKNGRGRVLEKRPKSGPQACKIFFTAPRVQGDQSALSGTPALGHGGATPATKEVLSMTSRTGKSARRPALALPFSALLALSACGEPASDAPGGQATLSLAGAVLTDQTVTDAQGLKVQLLLRERPTGAPLGSGEVITFFAQTPEVLAADGDGLVPLGFEIPLRPDLVKADLAYSLEAKLLEGDRVLFASPAPVSVFGEAEPLPRRLQLARSPETAPGALDPATPLASAPDPLFIRGLDLAAYELVVGQWTEEEDFGIFAAYHLGGTPIFIREIRSHGSLGQSELLVRFENDQIRALEEHRVTQITGGPAETEILRRFTRLVFVGDTPTEVISTLDGVEAPLTRSDRADYLDQVAFLRDRLAQRLSHQDISDPLEEIFYRCEDGRDIVVTFGALGDTATLGGFAEESLALTPEFASDGMRLTRPGLTLEATGARAVLQAEGDAPLECDLIQAESP